MDQCKATSALLQNNFKLHNDDGSKELDATLYRKLDGSLIYLTITMPHLGFAIIVLSQFMLILKDVPMARCVGMIFPHVYIQRREIY